MRTFSTRGETVYAVQVSADQTIRDRHDGMPVPFSCGISTRAQLRFHRDYWRWVYGQLSASSPSWWRLGAWLGWGWRTRAGFFAIGPWRTSLWWRRCCCSLSFGGTSTTSPGYPLCFSAVGSVAVLLGSSALLAIGVVFGRGRVLVRLSLALAAFALLWAWPVWVWHGRRWGASVKSRWARASSPCSWRRLSFVAYRRGWRIVDRQSQDAANSTARFQFPLQGHPAPDGRHRDRPCW